MTSGWVTQRGMRTISNVSVRYGRDEFVAMNIGYSADFKQMEIERAPSQSPYISQRTTELTSIDIGYVRYLGAYIQSRMEAASIVDIFLIVTSHYNEPIPKNRYRSI